MLRSCLGKAVPTAGRVVWPEDGDAYTWARKMAFARSALPAVVVYAYSTADVAETVKCAGAWGYQVSAVGRRHSYQGRSVMSGYAIIDLSNITAITINKEAMTGNVGAGATNAIWLHAVATSGIPGAAALIGSCASVGVTGFVLGGGQGDISPYVGMGSDQLVEAEVVLANGSVVLANKKTNKDLYWALQGGGGGFGVVTRMTLKIATVPDPDRVTWMVVEYAESATVDAIMALQKYLNKGDKRLGGNAILVSGPTAKGHLQLVLIFLGSTEDAIGVLKGGGLLQASWMAPAASTFELNFASQAPLPAWMPATGVAARQFPNYAYAEAQVEAAAEAIGLPPVVPYPCNQTNLDRIIANIGQPNSPINVGISSVWYTDYPYIGTGGVQVRNLPKEAWEAIIKAAKDPGPDDGSAYWKVKAKVKNEQVLAINNHLSHGAVGEVSPSATAYRWRDRHMLVTWDSFGAGIWEATTTAERESIIKATTEVASEIRAALAPHLTKKDGGYINYMALGVQRFEEFYFGKNAKRLLKVKEMYDPNGLFSKPSVVGPSGDH
ncbi:MAG: hypothetical protein J3K34DRAFT_470084 [Monoraphidium minutum]|nr:MAG: hypothetical protein J3K34DRAFT_470084 [Monoraphidium minutum]